MAETIAGIQVAFGGLDSSLVEGILRYPEVGQIPAMLAFLVERIGTFYAPGWKRWVGCFTNGDQVQG